MEVLIVQNINLESYDKMVEDKEEFKLEIDSDSKFSASEKVVEKLQVDESIKLIKMDKARMIRKAEAYQDFLNGKKVDPLKLTE